jgi:hypothetical protein
MFRLGYFIYSSLSQYVPFSFHYDMKVNRDNPLALQVTCWHIWFSYIRLHWFSCESCLFRKFKVMKDNVVWWSVHHTRTRTLTTDNKNCKQILDTWFYICNYIEFRIHNTFHSMEYIMLPNANVRRHRHNFYTLV